MTADRGGTRILWRSRLLAGLASTVMATPAAMGQCSVAQPDASDRDPVLVRLVKPKFTEAARAALVQGSVILEVVVSEGGEPTGVTVISPLGFGLDEAAVAAVRQWRYRPALRHDRPLAAICIVQVHFNLVGLRFNWKREERRAAYNSAAAALNLESRRDPQEAVKTLERLAQEKYPPAMCLLGVLLRDGRWVDKDASRAVSLIFASAEKGYGPALYEAGKMYRDGDLVPRDAGRGLKMWHKAATLGSVSAQYVLGVIHESGGEVPPDAERAQHYFRLCAAAGEAICQYRLGSSLVGSPSARPQDRVQGLAWCQLAAGQGIAGARQLVEREMPRLSAEEVQAVNRLKAQLQRQP